MNAHMKKPAIRTAIPSHRYQLGSFTVTVLTEIETSDPVPYQFIAAVMRDGDPEPGIYLIVERPGNAVEGKSALPLKLVMRDGAQVVRESERWWHADLFAEDVLALTKQILNLGDEEAYTLS
jgi:hypothetical protein